MLVADTYLGTVDDAALQRRLDREDTIAVTLDETERRRSRVRTATQDGTAVGVVVGRELRDGDVLDADGTLVVVSLADVAAMVVDVADAAGAADDATSAILDVLRLGHAVGNRHWDLAIDGTRAYLPRTEDPERMEAAVRPLLPAGATITYEDVTPALFDAARGTSGHDHSDGHPHGHGPEDGHGHALDHHGRHARNFQATDNHQDQHPDGVPPIRGEGDTDSTGGEES